MKRAAERARHPLPRCRHDRHLEPDRRHPSRQADAAEARRGDRRHRARHPRRLAGRPACRAGRSARGRRGLACAKGGRPNEKRPCPHPHQAASPRPSITCRTRCPSIPTIPASPSTPSRWRRCASTSRRSSAAPRRCRARRTVKKEWQAAWLVRAIELHRPDHALRRRHRGPRAAALRQGAAAAARTTSWTALGLGDRRLTVGAVCVYHRFVATAARRSRAPAFRSPRSPPASRPASSPLETRLARDRGVGRRRRRRDRHRHHPRARADRQLAGALRRGARLHATPAAPAHMKAILGTGDLKTLRNVGARLAGRHDGRRRLHQDLDRQGRRQRHAAGRPGHGARHPRLSRDDRLHRRLQAGRRHLDRQGRPDLPVPDEGGARQRLAAAGPVPHRRLLLLADIERQLEHYVTGRYSAFDHHAMA